MRKLPFWCQKVLPLVYDGALSYYETISKVVAKLNELISWSNGVDATVSAAGEAANEAEDKAIDALNTAERAEGKATEAKATANEAKSIAQGIAGDIPTKTSELTNDSGFITDADIPTKTSDLTNDSGFITDADVPTKTSELTNDSGFITDADVPTKTSELTNDSGFVDASGASAAAPVQSVNGKIGSVLTYGTVTSVSDLITAANSMGVEVPFLFNCDYQTAIALGGISASCGGIARLVAANGRLDYIIFQGSGYGAGENAVVGRIDSANGTVNSYRKFATTSDLPPERISDTFSYTFSYASGTVGSRPVAELLSTAKTGYKLESFCIAYATGTANFIPIAVKQNGTDNIYVCAYRATTSAVSNGAIAVLVNYVKI